MSKQSKTTFMCGECGYESSKWLGKCPACGSWNTMVEAPSQASPRAGRIGSAQRAVALSEVTTRSAQRVSTGIGEFDRVLGGGLVGGGTVLIGGDPGIGKSTLLMQTAANLSLLGRVLYVTGEESASQLKLRAERLGVDANANFLLLAETDLTVVESEFDSVKPDYLIIDSIQTMYCPELPAASGSVSQVREATSMLTRIAKGAGCTVFIVGHVTKEGAIAGPRVLEHMVDTVLYFEGDRHDAYRLLRAVKNRFGSTNEVGVFEMQDTGMTEVTDPSDLFVSGTRSPGCAITCALEGSRPMLVEVQSLVSPTAFNNPRRMASGIDQNRLVLLIAVLEKKVGLKLYDKDVYVNVVGGISLYERSSDLAIALCIASAALDKPLPASTALVGELALTGEVRNVSQVAKRIQECERLGYSDVITPKDVKTIAQAVAML